MKSVMNLINMALLCLIMTTAAMAQSTPKPTVGVLDIDISGFTQEPKATGNMTRTELSKLDLFEVMDAYDIEFLLDKNAVDPTGCYGKLCLIEIGKQIKTDKMLTGKIELAGDAINTTFRLIDVGTQSVEKTHVMEFLNLRQQLKSIIQVSLQKMFDQEVDNDLLTKLTKRDDYKSSVNTDAPRLNLNGPRMGVMMMTGEMAEIFKAAKSEGGMDLLPVMFQFGYQWEIQYINQGDFQALFEFIPTITGMDQGKFIPSISVLNGMRSSRTGLEFAFGPIFYATQKAKGYRLEDGWTLESAFPEDLNRNDYTLERRVDSRGTYALETRFVFGVGKTFKSGKLNIPVNVFFIPSKEGHRFGLSVGYNVSR